MQESFIRGVSVEIGDESVYPFDIPAVKQLSELQFEQPVTFLVGENGSGKSTIIEALATAAGFSGEGGTKNVRFSTYDTVSNLSEVIRLHRGSRRERGGYFLRAESFYNVASDMEAPNLDGPMRYGGKSMHEQSHGESFLWLVNHQFRGNALYILDEPEAALSPQRQLALMVAIHDLTKLGSQFIIATHSPILLAFPGGVIYHLNTEGINEIAYDDIEHVQLTKAFLNDPRAYLTRLFSE